MEICLFQKSNQITKFLEHPIFLIIFELYRQYLMSYNLELRLIIMDAISLNQ